MQKDYLVDGKYKILDVLGKGGMSTVYLAENIKLGTLWAIKEVNKLSNSKVDLLAEPNILKKLNHPALPKIFDIIESEESIYIIVDYIEGNSLEKELQESGSFSEDIALNWAKQLCEVLIYLHGFKPNPIIYRDMKPSNLIISKSGDIKLIDFGIAREYKEDSEGDTVYIGTRGYAAPEQYGFGQTNVTSDIYSLGITLFHIVTGRNPIDIPGEIKPLRNYNNKLSKEMEAMISKCIQHNPEERFQSAKELLTEIEAIICQTSVKINPAAYKDYNINIPADYKKVVGFAGDRGAGTTLLVAAISEFFASRNKNVAIMDLTKNCKLHSMYGWLHEEKNGEKRRDHESGIKSLLEWKPYPQKLDRHRCLYTSKEHIPLERNRYIDILESVRSSNDIILMDMDFDTDQEIIRYLDQLYIVKDMDMYNIKSTSDYLKNLQYLTINLSKIRFIINRYIKSSIKVKSIVDTITSYMTDEEHASTGFFAERRPGFFTVPFDMDNYRLTVESINQVQFSCSGFSQSFKKAIQEIAENIYPLKDRVSPNNKILDIFSILKGKTENEF